MAHKATKLSRREVEVLSLVARGFTNGEIGSMLIVSEDTVKSHIRHVIAKLEVRNRTHAVAVWLTSESAPDIVADLLIERAKEAAERLKQRLEVRHGG